jgi:hypothetical protein
MMIFLPFPESLKPYSDCQGKRQEVRIFAPYRGKSGVGVLKVRPGIPFKGQHALPVEFVVVYSGKRI